MEQIKKPNHRPFKELHIREELTAPYYTVYEVADALKVEHKTVRRMIKDGRLPATQIGRIWRIKKEDLERLFR